MGCNGSRCCWSVALIQERSQSNGRLDPRNCPDLSWPTNRHGNGGRLSRREARLENRSSAIPDRRFTSRNDVTCFIRDPAFCDSNKERCAFLATQDGPTNE